MSRLHTLLRTGLAAATTAAVLATAALPARAVELTVTHWGALMYGVPFAVAKEKGYFKEAGVPVDGFITSKGGGTTLRNALAAEVPYGEASLAAVVAAAQEGVPLTIVHSGVQSAGDILWVARKDDDSISTIHDLKGKKVSYTSPKSVSQMLLVMSLDMAELNDGKDLETVSLGGISAGLTALDEKGVDAAAILEPIWSKYKDKYKVVFNVNDLLPPVTQTVGVVRTDWLAENADTVAGIIEARRKGVDFIYQNPAEAAQILAEAYDMDPALAKSAVDNVVAMKYWSPGGFDYDGMSNMVQGLKLVGAMDRDAEVDWSTMVDESYLPDDLRTKM